MLFLDVFIKPVDKARHVVSVKGLRPTANRTAPGQVFANTFSCDRPPTKNINPRLFSNLELGTFPAIETI